MFEFIDVYGKNLSIKGIVFNHKNIQSAKDAELREVRISGHCRIGWSKKVLFWEFENRQTVCIAVDQV